MVFSSLCYDEKSEARMLRIFCKVMSSRDDRGVLLVFSSCGASVRFLTRCDGKLREPFVWHQGIQVSMRMARGSASLLSRYDMGIGPQDTLKQDSQGLSRVAAGNPGFRRLLQVTLG